MWSTGKKFRPSCSRNTAATRSTPCTPLKALAVADKPGYGTPSSHGTPDLRSGNSPYVRAKHVQIVDKDLQKSIPLFWAAINSGDRVDSALKDMAFVMKQVNRAEEAIEAIKSFRCLCSLKAQESIDNILLELYKKCGRIDDQIELLNFKLKMIDEELAFGGRRTKLTRSKGKKFHVSLDHEKSRLLGNLAWAYMQSENYEEAEPRYRKALEIEQDCNKQCNLAICLMKTGRLEEAKSILQYVKRASIGVCDELSLKSFEQASRVLMEIEPHDNLNEKKVYALSEGATSRSGNKEESQNSHNISVSISPQFKGEERINGADHGLEKAATTNDCKILNLNTLHGNSALSELDGGNSRSSGILINKNKSQRSIVLGKGSQRFKDVGKEEFRISSMRCPDYLDFDNNSIFSIGNTGKTPESTILTSDRTAEREHVSLNRREKSYPPKPKSLNKVWATKTVNTPTEKSNGTLPTSMDVDWNQESDAFINNRKQIDNSEEKTPTGSSKKYHSQISESNSASSIADAEMDGISIFLTGVGRTWADLVEEEQLATQNNCVAPESYLKTQLIKKSERKTWADMVEEEQFTNEKLRILAAALDKYVVASENYLKTQFVHKSERRIWADMVEEEESLANVSCSSSKAAVHTIESSIDSSEEYFRTPLLFYNGRSTWTDLPEEDGSLPDKSSRNGSAVNPNSSVRRALSFDP